MVADHQPLAKKGLIALPDLRLKQSRQLGRFALRIGPFDKCIDRRDPFLKVLTGWHRF